MRSEPLNTSTVLASALDLAGRFWQAANDLRTLALDSQLHPGASTPTLPSPTSRPLIMAENGADDKDALDFLELEAKEFDKVHQSHFFAAIAFRCDDIG